MSGMLRLPRMVVSLDFSMMEYHNTLMLQPLIMFLWLEANHGAVLFKIGSLSRCQYTYTFMSPA
jgi:hypothetical protein